MNALPFEPFVPRPARPLVPTPALAVASDASVCADEKTGEAGRDSRSEETSCVSSPDAAREEQRVSAASDDELLDHAPARCDPAACADRLRDEAIRLAATACAQALNVAVARNPMFVARFVDDALRSVRSRAEVRARLHPEIAAACAPLVACDVRPDASLGIGEVVVEADGALVRASIDERALILVRSAADA
jgi:hypothetical protein